MSTGNAGQRELVFCHECENEFWKQEHGLECPSCHSDFTEVIEQTHDPRRPDTPTPGLFADHLRDHNPWAHAQDAPDPDEDDVRRFEYRSPNSRVHFSSTFISSSGNRSTQTTGFGAEPNPFNIIGQMLNHMARPQEYPSQQQRQYEGQGGPFGPNSFPGRTAAGQDSGRGHTQFYSSSGPGFMFTSTGGPGNMDREDGLPANDLHQMLDSLFPPSGPPNGGSAGGPGGIQALLSAMLNPANAQSGDAVYSNEAFDRVLSQLMEQHRSGNAPGPASEAAIAALPRRPVGPRELGEEGKAECSICMDSVTTGVEISVLPCSHWFHPDCVKAWLSEHDTCPVCRSGITPKEGDQNSVRDPSQQPLNDEDPARVARRQSGSRGNPFIVPESPSRERRQPGFRQHSSNALNTPPGGYPGSDSGGDQQGASSNGSGGSGSISGRMRNFFGGGSSSGESSRKRSSGSSS
ncbi:hypothetical protein FH972_021344 [Carpinus fangiana]|uniref:RING-type E3 ubiquitin transferase n=1 Tax=Carpinus fangiana TaxID=176857 RepID=A0A5N6KPQ3_9ROSI|nr:hypothetical protein FH972_021344 [Carpinus fangiana]